MFRISAGKLFHNLGAAAVNNLSPNAARSLPLGRTSSMVACERKEYLAVSSEHWGSTLSSRC